MGPINRRSILSLVFLPILSLFRSRPSVCGPFAGPILLPSKKEVWMSEEKYREIGEKIETQRSLIKGLNDKLDGAEELIRCQNDALKQLHTEKQALMGVCPPGYHTAHHMVKWGLFTGWDGKKKIKNVITVFRELD